ncbi:nuclear transport factor 2 family protein [Niabella beijingensis]|uniref:nuclear transport factor 2 family protein n=1 Tax=Niabella beijingensis TaxID=2872700 RepID=UPI001CBDDFDF|nr:nuclear transport factor 2 family protein [Niabella beijingensis]MBZ4189977.1 nuclear transport factor 2 family protein [Niabella beijingensis]
MHVRFFAFLFLMLLVPAAGVIAQGKNVQQVEVAVKKLTKAMLDSDVPVLSALAAEKLTYGHSSGKVQDKAEFLESFKTGASDFTRIDITDQSIYFVNNTAIVRHLLDADTNDNKQPGHTTLKIMTVWTKVGSQWQLIARQAVKAQ